MSSSTTTTSNDMPTTVDNYHLENPLNIARENLRDFHCILLFFMVYIIILFFGAIGRFDILVNWCYPETWKKLFCRKKYNKTRIYGLTHLNENNSNNFFKHCLLGVYLYF